MSVEVQESIEEGLRLYGRGESERAFEVFLKVRSLDPQNDRVSGYLGALSAVLGREIPPLSALTEAQPIELTQTEKHSAAPVKIELDSTALDSTAHPSTDKPESSIEQAVAPVELTTIRISDEELTALQAKAQPPTEGAGQSRAIPQQDKYSAGVRIGGARPTPTIQEKVAVKSLRFDSYGDDSDNSDEMPFAEQIELKVVNPHSTTLVSSLEDMQKASTAELSEAAVGATTAFANDAQIQEEPESTPPATAAPVPAEPIALTVTPIEAAPVPAEPIALTVTPIAATPIFDELNSLPATLNATGQLNETDELSASPSREMDDLFAIPPTQIDENPASPWGADDERMVDLDSEHSQPSVFDMLMEEASNASSIPAVDVSATQIPSTPARDAARTSSSETTQDEPGNNECDVLMEGARELFALGDFSGSLELVEKVLEIDSSNAEAKQYLERNEATLLKMYESKLGNLEGRPRQMTPPDEVIWLNMHHRAGFVLSQVDGMLSFEEIADVSGLPRLETFRILTDLQRNGVIGT